MKNKKDLQELIKQKGGLIFSEGTLNLTHLLPTAYDVIVEFNLSDNIKEEIEKIFSNIDSQDKEEEASYIFNEDIFNLFNDIAPEGFYFSSHPGDGACFGWWKVEDEE